MLLFLEKEVGGQGHLGEATPLVRYTNNYNLVAHIFPCHTSLHEIAYYIKYHYISFSLFVYRKRYNKSLCKKCIFYNVIPKMLILG